MDCNATESSAVKDAAPKDLGKKEPPGTPTPEHPGSCGSPGSPVSDDTCPICLGHITDRCVADSCLHGFCLVCLKEWAKQKAVCPLCKLTFTKIMYEIKSESDYKEWKVPRPDPVAAERSARVANFQEFLDAERRRFFGYRTTNFPGANSLRRMQFQRINLPITDAIPVGPRERRPTRNNPRGSSMFRLSVYLNNIWVQPIADITGRYRQTGPELYREQPALTHRLVPWVNRELAALLPSSRVGVVLTEVMDLIERHAIDSREFRRAMRVHFGRNTNHFIHEFYHFARSPYDMVGHDNAALYMPRYGFDEDESTNSSSSSSDDSDAIVEVDAQGNPVTSRVNQGTSGLLDDVAREETLTQEGSVVISSDNSSDSDDEAQPTTSQGLSPSTHNPEPPRHRSMKKLIDRARNFLRAAVNEGASTSRSESASTEIGSATGLKTETPDSDESDACVIVEELPPKKERTPELINLDSEDDGPSTSSKKSHWKKKMTGEFKENPKSKKKDKCKGKSKPVLKRTNFPVGANACDGDGLGSAAVQDHSYCNEDGSDLNEQASTRSGSSSGSSTSTNYSDKRKTNDSDHSYQNKSSKRRRHCIYSDEESPDRSSSYEQRGRNKSGDRRRHSSGHARGTTTRAGTSRDRSGSATRQSTKDLHSKVKSSSKASVRASASYHPLPVQAWDNLPSNSTHSWDRSDSSWVPSCSSPSIASPHPDLSDSGTSQATTSQASSSRGSRSKHRSKSSSSKSSKKKKSKHKHKKAKKKKKSKAKKSARSSVSSESESSDSDERQTSKKKKKDNVSSDSDSTLVERHKKKAKTIAYSTDSSTSDSD